MGRDTKKFENPWFNELLVSLVSPVSLVSHVSLVSLVSLVSPVSLVSLGQREIKRLSNSPEKSAAQCVS
jgi:hypothetical protein